MLLSTFAHFPHPDAIQVQASEGGVKGRNAEHRRVLHRCQHGGQHALQSVGQAAVSALHPVRSDTTSSNLCDATVIAKCGGHGRRKPHQERGSTHPQANQRVEDALHRQQRQL